ncbi:MAG: zeta toxin family protein, partial [Bacilli bacterium]
MKPVIIGIAGGTASGKTTVAKKLYHESLKYGTVVVIRID